MSTFREILGWKSPDGLLCLMCDDALIEPLIDLHGHLPTWPEQCSGAALPDGWEPLHDGDARLELPCSACDTTIRHSVDSHLAATGALAAAAAAVDPLERLSQMRTSEAIHRRVGDLLVDHGRPDIAALFHRAADERRDEQ